MNAQTTAECSFTNGAKTMFDMRKNQSICTRCIMDTTVPDIRFEENGECNYCKIHDKISEEHPLNGKGQGRLEKIVVDIKRKGKGKKYDCIVGVSGGADSSYVLYLAKKFGLRPLAVHLDNGWNTQTAVDNMKNVTEILGVNLRNIQVALDQFSDLQIAFLKASVPDAEIPTDQAIKPVLYKIAAQEGISYVIHGNSFRTEGKIPPLWSYGDYRYIKDVYKRFGKGSKLLDYPHLTFFDMFWYMSVKRIKLFRLLFFIDYQKDVAKQILKEKLGWSDYGGKHYESIYTRFVQSYLLLRKFNIDKRKVHLSAQIRSGLISRSDALVEISKPPISSVQAEKDKEYILRKLGVTERQFDMILAAEPKCFLDYRSSYDFIKRLRIPIKIACRLISSSTPPLLFHMDTD